MANYSIKTLGNFYEKLKNPGLRTNHQFQIEFHGDDVDGAWDSFIVFAESSSLPGRRTISNPTPFYGFNFQVPTNIQYDQEWTATIRCDAELTTRKLMEVWHDKIGSLKSSTGGKKGLVPTNTYALVHMISPSFYNNGSMTAPIRTYKMVGLYPLVLGPINLGHGDNGISTYTTTFQMQYWYAEDDGDPLA